MSAEVFALVGRYYDPQRFQAPIIVAYILANQADDGGGGISESISELAQKARMHPRSMQRAMRNLEKFGLLTCEEKSAGGAGNSSLYRLNLSVLVGSKNPGITPPITPALRRGSDPDNPGITPPFDDPQYKGSTTKNVQGGSNATVIQNPDDERLARWMFDRIKAINPKHREPNWASWERDIRLMRERDKRTHREISRLFSWANAHRFWHQNVLCPATLREKWDKLVIARRSEGGPDPAADPDGDRQCERILPSGNRCTNLWTWREAGKPAHCRGCIAELQEAHLRGAPAHG